MVVKHCPITKVNSMLDATLMPAPAARVSRGWISLQITSCFSPFIKIQVSIASIVHRTKVSHDRVVHAHERSQAFSKEELTWGTASQ